MSWNKLTNALKDNVANKATSARLPTSFKPSNIESQMKTQSIQSYGHKGSSAKNILTAKNGKLQDAGKPQSSEQKKQQFLIAVYKNEQNKVKR